MGGRTPAGVLLCSPAPVLGSARVCGGFLVFLAGGFLLLCFANESIHSHPAVYTRVTTIPGDSHPGGRSYKYTHCCSGNFSQIPLRSRPLI